MLKYFVLLCLALGLSAHPSESTREEIDQLKAFLLKTQHDDQMTLQEAMSRNPRAKVWENSGKYQGDILLDDDEIDEMVKEFADQNNVVIPRPRNAIRNKAGLWPGRTVYYQIAPHFNRNQIALIQSAAKYFGEKSCVRWVPRTNQRDFVLIGGRQRGCFAYIGYVRNKGVHVLNLAPNCFQLYVIIHEMSHIIGFHHMHQTYTRDNFITIDYRNVEERERFNFNNISRNTVSLLDLPYEYASNMHYGRYAFSKNNRQTIIPKFNDHGLMGQQNYVTRFDVLRWNRLYNCPGAWAVKVTKEDLDKPYDQKFGNRIRSAALREANSRF